MDADAGWRAAAAVLAAGVAVVVGAGVLVVVWRGRPWAGRVAAVAGPLSLGLTALGWAVRPFREEDRLVGLVGVAELLALLALVTLTVRAGRARPAVAGLAVAAVCWPLRYVDADAPLDLLELLAFGAGGVLLVALVGLYLGALDEQRRREVAAARRTQRLELAHDLHDFVAHDVSGMLAWAQAGAIVAASDPERSAEVFRRIEESGRQALAALDRTVHLLRAEGADGATRAPQPGLGELRELVERFTAAGPARVSLDVPAEPVGREVAGTAYRIVVEALTNVRRHAPGARTVAVRVSRESARLKVSVTDDGPPGRHPTRRTGGHGLAALSARAEALGGSLTAGRTGDGWRVAAVLPLEGR